MKPTFPFDTDSETLKGCEIYAMLTSNDEHISFHTPGHKAGSWDITELDFSDNLSCPQGVLARAEHDAARILGAEGSFFLTDGSTSGVLSMLYAAKGLGVRSLAFPKNAHKCVYNGCKILDIRPVLLDAPLSGTVRLQPTAEETEKKLKQADALLLTSPDYYGNIADLAFARALCDREGKLLLVDGAHGGHLHYAPELYAGTYADLWVDGVHKSLPALTQGAVVSARSSDLFARLMAAVDIFRTSSPSYPILASVEYAIKYPRNRQLENEVLAFINEYPDKFHFGGDWTKLCARLGGRAFKAQEKLERKGIYAEFCDGDILMFYLSPATRENDFRLLKKELAALFALPPLPARPREDIFGDPDANDRDEGDGFSADAEKETGDRPKRVRPVFEIPELVYVPLSRATGRIAARPCGIFPPGTPLVLRGERATAEAIRLLEKSPNVFGLGKGKTFPAIPEKGFDEDRL